jgi:hypothetical protein
VGIGRAASAVPGRIAAGAAAAIAVVLACAPAGAFELDGHEIVEAAAYKRLLATEVVPGTGLSGRAVLAALIAAGVLDEPPCFDRVRPNGDCGAAERLDLPLLYWPTLHAGAADLVLDRQLGQQGQCQHFMANTGDGLTAPDPRLGVPSALVTEAYERCVRLAGAVFDLVLRDPQLARWRLAGTYVLMHALQDSFSAAHVDRDSHFQIRYLLSWKLIDWPRYAWHGHLQFPAPTHHGITDPRDADFLRRDARSRDGRSCDDFHNPYAFPDECLTERGKAAADTIVDLLVAIYKVRAGAAKAGRQPSLFSSSGDEAVVWLAFAHDHLASVAARPVLPATPATPLRRSDVFIGPQVIGGDQMLGGGLWAAKLFLGLTTPFVLGLTGGAAYTRADGVGQIAAGTNVALLLPLIRRLTIGAAPAGVRVACDTRFETCRPDIVAGLGVVLVPLGDALWMGVEGPRWSWTERAIGRSWVGLSFGWSHERIDRRDPPLPDALATWDPPRVEDVHAFRSARSTRTVYFAATALSQPENTFGGFGLEWRWDRDIWNRRAGFAPGVQLEIDGGRIEARDPGGGAAVAPVMRAYLLPNRLAVTATPALVRLGAIAGRALAADIAGRAGVALEVGRLDLVVDSPPLSYVSTARWHPVPVTVRLGMRLD